MKQSENLLFAPIWRLEVFEICAERKARPVHFVMGRSSAELPVFEMFQYWAAVIFPFTHLHLHNNNRWLYLSLSWFGSRTKAELEFPQVKEGTEPVSCLVDMFHAGLDEIGIQMILFSALPVGWILDACSSYPGGFLVSPSSYSVWMLDLRWQAVVHTQCLIMQWACGRSGCRKVNISKLLVAKALTAGCI